MRKVEAVVVAVALALVSPVLGGCGAAPSRSPGFSGARKKGGEARSELPYPGSVRESSDSDSDGLPDQVDMAPGGAMAYPQPAPPVDAPKPEPGKGGTPTSTENAPHEADRALVIYTANITMAVYQVEQGILAVERVAKDNQGFLAQKGDRAITIRVPKGRFEAALGAIDQIGDITHRDIQAQDVTEEFVDIEIRIKNAKAMRLRLQSLLERANVKEALEIEKELHRVTQELELLEGKIKLLKDRIAYSTITVTFAPRGASLQASKIRLPFPFLGQLGLPNLLTLTESK